jgi:hypothetical protein
LIFVLILESRKRALFSQRLIRQLKVGYQLGFNCDCIYGNVRKSKIVHKSNVGVKNKPRIKPIQNGIY